MSANASQLHPIVAPIADVVLMVVGKNLRRDLRITFECARCEFRVALFPKGKRPYYDRGGQLALGGDKQIWFSDTMLHIGGAMFAITTAEREQIESWMASLPSPQGAA